VRDVLQRINGPNEVHDQLLLASRADLLEQAIAGAPVGAEDTLIVFFSGHADADGLHLGSATVPFERLKNLVEASAARVKLLIVDACRSGGITRTKGASPAESFAIAIENRLDVEGMAIVTSSAGSEDSQESDVLRGSFFTHHLIHGLLGPADRDRDRQVTLHEAYGYAYRETLRSTGRTSALQHPTFAYDLTGRGEMVLARLDRDRGSAVVSLSDPGSYLVFDEQDALFAELYIEEPSARYLLPAGKWLIQRRDGDLATEHQVSLSAGEERLLSVRDAEPVLLTRLAAKGRADDGRPHRLSLLGGVHGSLLGTGRVEPSLWGGYRHALGDFDLGLDLRLTQDPHVHLASALRARVEGGADLGFARVGVGLAIEAAYDRQSWPVRATQFYAGFGAVASSELKLSGPFTVRVEGGPTLHLMKLRDESSERMSAPLAWWLAGGPTWGF
jgi:hypothetical protein